MLAQNYQGQYTHIEWKQFKSCKYMAILNKDNKDGVV